MNRKKIEQTAYELTRQANLNLRTDALRLLKVALKDEKISSSKKTIDIIIKNADIAKKKKLAICQDTGLPLVFIEVGKGEKINKDFIDSVNSGIVRAYRECGFRPSTVKPFSSKSSFNPEIYHIEFSNIKGIKLTILPKGFGSENKSQVKMFNPTASWNEISEFIVGVVRDAGPNACPPFFVGVGIGQTSDGALLLAKKALTKTMDKKNNNKDLKLKEEELLKKINDSNIGPMGFGGKNTALAVKIESAATHIAGLPVGVNISCHALRSATAKIKN